MKSWYPATNLSKKQIRYLKLIQEIWQVKNANEEWVPYKLTPHQIEWHSQDIAVLREKAKTRIVVKSRNTSFTVSSIISSLMDVPNRESQIIPFVRLNKERAIDLLSEVKEHIKHMTPIRLTKKVINNGKEETIEYLYPFDPNKVYMDKAMSITFPNGVEFRAFPANAMSAETIRGMRIVGSAGINDEGNFMPSFQKIYIATRDASRGSFEGSKEFQMNIGTTRKGRMTNFNIWFEKIEKDTPSNIQIFYWPVLKHHMLDLNKSILEQAEDLGLITIVPWHTLEDLENKRKENLQTFLEEYMAILVDAEEQLYRHSLIEGSVDENLTNTEPVEGEQYTMGIDPAASNHLFAISIFEKHSKIQKYLYYERGTPLPAMEKFCMSLINKWKPVRVVIDGNGLGYQLAQTLENMFGVNIVKVIRGAASIKILDKKTQNIPMKEFVHTNQIKLMNYGEVGLIPDEMQIKHYMMWKNDYEADDDKELGHGDIVISNGFALLPDRFQFGVKKYEPKMSKKREEIIQKVVESKREEAVEW